MQTPLVSVIIPTWNGRHLLGACLDSLCAQSYQPLEILVVDGGSSDGSGEFLKAAYPNVGLLALPSNLGFTGNVNAGLRAAQGDLLCLLNNDAVANQEWIQHLVSALLAQPNAGTCASKMLTQDGARIDSAGDLLGRNGLAWQRGAGEADRGQFDLPSDVFSACGGAACYRAEMLRDVGLLDEGYGSYLEDVDLGLRAQLRGWGCRYEPRARVRHLGSATGGGPLASFHVARNSIRLIVRGFPTPIVRASLRLLLDAQARRAREAFQAWRGEAARATLKGLIAGLANMPDALRGRGPIQRGRRISNDAFLALLEHP
ncbi:MAG: glycosyltransferase family 2 protein [Chloroflexota bacterium]